MAKLALKILVDGAQIESGWSAREGTVRQVEIAQALNQHTRCTVELSQTADARPPIDRWIGRALSLESTTTGVKLFSGFVLDAKLTYQASGSFLVILKGVSFSYKLEMTRRFFYYGPTTLSSVAQQIGGWNGVQIETNATGTQPGLDLVQWDESDWNYLWRLCDDAGCYLVPTDTGLRIDKGFSQAGPELQWRSDQDTGIVEFSIGGSLGNPSVNGSHYDFSHSKSQSFQQVKQDPALTGGSGALADAVKQQSRFTFQPGQKSWRHRTKTIEDFNQALQQEAEWSIGSRLACEGVSRCEALAPGQKVQAAGIDGGSGAYNITQVEHAWTSAGYTNRFLCTPWINYRSSPHPERPVLAGLYSARVVNIDDPQRQGQIQVQYYWQEQGQTGWIRHLTPYAGADRGIFFRPELGDEVMVGFEEGDPERPVILGSAWNMTDTIPNEDFWGGETHSNDVKRIVTKSGHRLSFVDKPGAESIALATPTHAKLVLHEHTTETGRPAIVMDVENGDLIFNAPNGRIHFHSKYWSREVGE